MDLSPAQISEASFPTVRKGYDPAEVDAFLAEAARALEDARQQATAMEARARAAVARLQADTARRESSGGGSDTADQESTDADSVHIPAADAETISRTLVLAQLTADWTVTEARAEAERIEREAAAEAQRTVDSSREMAAQTLEDARVEARRSSELERQAAENEVQALVARREFLIGDVDQLERFLIDQRERLRAAARQIQALCERVPAGLGSVRPPALSASDDAEPGDPTQELTRPITRPDDAEAAAVEPGTGDARPVDDAAAVDPGSDDTGSGAEAAERESGTRDTDPAAEPAGVDHDTPDADPGDDARQPDLVPPDVRRLEQALDAGPAALPKRHRAVHNPPHG